ncbi:hypothetical protein bcere0022_39890 [Bacillus cereus Rock3-44]|nr:hypothetical protein bcere0022_39890 [Bacillus cereus Rock3-44]
MYMSNNRKYFQKGEKFISIENMTKQTLPFTSDIFLLYNGFKCVSSQKL